MRGARRRRTPRPRTSGTLFPILSFYSSITRVAKSARRLQCVPPAPATPNAAQGATAPGLSIPNSAAIAAKIGEGASAAIAGRKRACSAGVLATWRPQTKTRVASAG
jgi:hypothetical protein